MCPAAGQGALAIETRAGDETVREVISFLDDKASHIETTCERALLKKMGGGCQVPIGASATATSATQSQSVERGNREVISPELLSSTALT
jgi:porphobilinogen deaminase